MRRFVVALLALVLVTPAARAQSANAVEADRLFTESKALAEAGRHREACPKLERSLALDPAIGTEFNLADCNEHVGQLASAYTHYRNVRRDARRAGKSEREAAASARLDALRPRLGWVRVEPGQYAPAAFRFEVDGVPVALPEGDSVPLDPGPHTLTAIGGNELGWRAQIVAKAHTTLLARPFNQKPSTGARLQRNAAFALGGLGLAGLAVGASAGIVSLVAHGSASSSCPDPEIGCPSAPPSSRARAQDGVDAWQRATTAGTLSTIGFVAGGVALAAAVVLYVTAPRDPRARTALQTGTVRF